MLVIFQTSKVKDQSNKTTFEKNEFYATVGLELLTMGGLPEKQKFSES